MQTNPSNFAPMGKNLNQSEAIRCNQQTDAKKKQIHPDLWTWWAITDLNDR